MPKLNLIGYSDAEWVFADELDECDLIQQKIVEYLANSKPRIWIEISDGQFNYHYGILSQEVQEMFSTTNPTTLTNLMESMDNQRNQLLDSPGYIGDATNFQATLANQQVEVNLDHYIDESDSM